MKHHHLYNFPKPINGVHAIRITGNGVDGYTIECLDQHGRITIANSTEYAQSMHEACDISGRMFKALIKADSL